MEGLGGAEIRPVPCRTVESMVPSPHPPSSYHPGYVSIGGGGGASSQRSHATKFSCLNLLGAVHFIDVFFLNKRAFVSR